MRKGGKNCVAVLLKARGAAVVHYCNNLRPPDSYAKNLAWGVTAGATFSLTAPLYNFPSRGRNGDCGHSG